MNTKSKVCSAVMMFVLCMGLLVHASAWSSSTPPSSSNTGTLTTSGVTISFETSGIYKSIDTTKCYKDISKFTVKGIGLYAGNNSTKKITVTMRADYWNPSKTQWEKGNSYSKLLPATNAKRSDGQYMIKPQNVSGVVNAKGITYYHYGILVKDYTSVVMYGKFQLIKNQ